MSELNAPRASVEINGVPYAPIEVDVDQNAHGATDTATIILPTNGGKPDFSTLFAGVGTKQVPVTIKLGFGSGALQSYFSGNLDQSDVHFGQQEVTFTCRSLAALLVDNPVTAVARNMTSIAFIQQYATQVGLTVQYALVGTPVTVQEVMAREFIGGASYATTLYRMKVWDLILQCAQFDDVDVWVNGTTLYYMAPSLVQRTNVGLVYGKDITVEDDITGTHALQFNKNIQVEVRTYQPRTRQSTTVRVTTNVPSLAGGVSVTQSSKTVTSQPVFGTPNLITSTIGPTGVTTTTSTASGGSFTAKPSQGTESTKERYIYFIPNLTPGQANAKAQSLWRQISQHEYAIRFKIPMTSKLFGSMGITSLLNLSGLYYQKFNSQYYPRRIQTHVSVAQGASWSVEAVNHVLPQGAV